MMGRERVLRVLYRAVHPALGPFYFVSRLPRDGSKLVVENDGRVLLVRHTYGDRRRWELPGGRISRGETPEMAARRQLREELGVDVGELRPLGMRPLHSWGRDHPVHFFAVRVDPQTVRRDEVEIAEVRWFAPDALPARLGHLVGDVLGASAAPGG
jgi:8-oxo-dGTP pyrophosphatase MutT (NUDIX family)